MIFQKLDSGTYGSIPQSIPYIYLHQWIPGYYVRILLYRLGSFGERKYVSCLLSDLVMAPLLYHGTLQSYTLLHVYTNTQMLQEVKCIISSYHIHSYKAVPCHTHRYGTGYRGYMGMYHIMAPRIRMYEAGRVWRAEG